MGNTCAGPSSSKNGFFQSVSATLWRSRTANDDSVLPPPGPPLGSSTSNGGANQPDGIGGGEPPSPVINKPPEPVQMPEVQPIKVPAPVPDSTTLPVPAAAAERPSPKKPHHVKKASTAGLQTDSVLRRKTENLKDKYSLGRKLGQGQFGTTYLCVDKGTGNEFACKSIAKRKLVTEEDVEDVRREIQIMYHLSGHPNVISIVGAYEDVAAIHLVMELCSGGELFDRIVQKGHYTERKAAELARVIVGVVEACHSMGVMHRDLKPENFLFVDQQEESRLKTIDFGLSIFFRPEWGIADNGSFYITDHPMPGKMRTTLR